MDDGRIGRSLRALRRRRRLRQSDVARLARVSQSTISVLERGHVGTLSLQTIRRIFAAVDAGFEGMVMWRGGAVDRLMDERHATLVGAAATTLRDAGWEVASRSRTRCIANVGRSTCSLATGGRGHWSWPKSSPNSHRLSKPDGSWTRKLESPARVSAANDLAGSLRHRRGCSSFPTLTLSAVWCIAIRRPSM